MSVSTFAASPIDTDGPDFVESSEAVGRGRSQFEANLDSQRDRRRGTRRTSTPTLLRYGVTETIEARIEIAGEIQITDSTRSTTASETLDAAFGLKWHSQDRDTATGKPSIAWILHFDAPSGTGESRGIGIRSSLRSVIIWDLPRDWSLGLMPGLKRNATTRAHTRAHARVEPALCATRYQGGLASALTPCRACRPTRGTPLRVQPIRLAAAQAGGASLRFRPSGWQ